VPGKHRTHRALPGDAKRATRTSFRMQKQPSSTALVADELWRLSPENFHIQDAKVAVSGVSFQLGHSVAGCTQNLGQFNSFARDERCQLMTKSQAVAFIEGHSA